MLARLRSVPDPGTAGVDGERAFFEAVGAMFPVHPDVSVRQVDTGGVPAELVVAPGADAGSVVLYLHGGAFVIGSARIYREQSARLSRATGYSVLTLDYRLAPEHPFPAALDDTLAALRWLREARGIPAGRIVVAGDSAGGNLALAALISMRENGEPMPAVGVLISPWVDLECSGETMLTNADPRHLAQRSSLLDNAATYLGGQDPRQPLASPIYADLSGLPPLLIQAGAAETLLADARNLASRAESAGVDVQFEEWDGMIHEWHLLAALLPENDPLPEAEAAIEGIARFIRERVGH